MRLTFNEKEINDHFEIGAIHCEQRAKEMQNKSLNAKIETEEADKSRGQWLTKAMAMRGLKFQEHI